MNMSVLQLVSIILIPKMRGIKLENCVYIFITITKLEKSNT